MRSGFFNYLGSFDVGAIDPFWSDVVSLLHFNGSDGSTTFTDETGVVWTPSGNAEISTANKVFGSGAYNGDGNNDYISASSSGFVFGAGDFTIEGFTWMSGPTAVGGTAGSAVFDSRSAEPSANMYIDIASSGALRFYVSGAYRIQSPSSLMSAGFRHWAIVRSSGVTSMYVNGVSRGTWNDSTNYLSSSVHIAGRFAAVSGDFRSLNGYIDEFRITKGVARYTANFTPPGAPFPSVGP